MPDFASFQQTSQADIKKIIEDFITKNKLVNQRSSDYFNGKFLADHPITGQTYSFCNFTGAIVKVKDVDSSKDVRLF